MRSPAKMLLSEKCVVLGYVVLLTTTWLTLCSGSTAQDCSSELGKVSNCVSYVTDGASTLSTGCCKSVLSMYSTNEKCLCYLVEQAYTNASQLGATIDMKRLLALPTDCKIQGANSTKCIAELGLTPSSPGAAVFLPSSSKTSPGAAPTTTTTAAPSIPKNGAFVYRALSLERLTILAIAAFLSVFPVGLIMHAPWST
ncbi:hypothetical protein Dimus_031776 [Dionaea muscipula]